MVHREYILHTFCMLVAERLSPHVTKPDGTLAAAVHKVIAVLGMELCCCNNLKFELLLLQNSKVYTTDDCPRRKAKIVCSSYDMFYGVRFCRIKLRGTVAF